MTAVPLALGLSLVSFGGLWAGHGQWLRQRERTQTINPNKTIQQFLFSLLPQPAFQPAEKKRSLIG